LRYVNPWPRPVQKPHPPVWIPGGGSVETWHWCAERDYVYSYLSYYGHQEGKATMNGFWEEMKRLGKDPNPFRGGFLQFVGVAETRAEALKLYKEPAEYFYGRCLHIDPRFVSPPGYTSEATIRARVTSQVSLAAQRARVLTQAQQWDEIVERGYVVVGSPGEVAEQLSNVARTLNVGHLMLLLQFGNMNRELTLHNTSLFAERVMPQLRGIFENEWEDRWWPKPMPPAERVAPATPVQFRTGAAG
jgi:alkanesulfonate monooxygenase SsuD/methylene tetrahydromethanopterin reductase-like flavin-dependent oxidoreductase (luciferase family)